MPGDVVAEPLGSRQRAIMSIFLFDHPEIPVNEDARENAVVRSGLLDTKGAPQLLRIVEAARRVACTRSAAITVISGDSQHIVAASGTPMGVTRRSTSFCAHIIADGADSMCILDAANDPRLSGNPHVEDGYVRFYAGMAIQNLQGLTLGALCVFDPLPKPVFSGREKARLRELADEVLRGPERHAA
jgi:GAF domain-containing protein